MTHITTEGSQGAGRGTGRHREAQGGTGRHGKAEAGTCRQYLVEGARVMPNTRLGDVVPVHAVDHINQLPSDGKDQHEPTDSKGASRLLEP